MGCGWKGRPRETAPKAESGCGGLRSVAPVWPIMPQGRLPQPLVRSQREKCKAWAPSVLQSGVGTVMRENIAEISRREPAG